MAPYTPQSRPRFFYGWVVVAGGFLNQVLNSGLGYQGFGTFLLHLEREFGWSRAQISGAHSTMFVVMGIVGVFMGRVNDQVGPRLLLTVSTIVFGLGFALISKIDTVWELSLIHI